MQNVDKLTGNYKYAGQDLARNEKTEKNVENDNVVFMFNSDEDEFNIIDYNENGVIEFEEYKHYKNVERKKAERTDDIKEGVEDKDTKVDGAKVDGAKVDDTKVDDKKTEVKRLSKEELNDLAEKIANGYDLLKNYSDKLCYDDYLLLDKIATEKYKKRLEKETIGNTQDNKIQPDEPKAPGKPEETEKPEGAGKAGKPDEPKTPEKPEGAGKAGEPEKTKVTKSFAGSGKYQADGIKRAEDAVSNEKVLSKSARTLSEKDQKEILKKAGVDISDFEVSKAEDGVVCLKSKDGTQFYRVVKQDDEIKIISTLMQGNNAFSNVYNVDIDSSKYEAPKQKVNVAEYSKRLNNAINGVTTKGKIIVDKKELETIFNNENISDDDFVLILSDFEKNYGCDKYNTSITRFLDTRLSSQNNKNLISKVSERLANSASKGNNQAVELICKEIYASINGIGTAEAFLESLFDNLDDETIKKVNEQYSKVTGGKSLLQDIKDDYFIGGNNIISKIEKAIKTN